MIMDVSTQEYMTAMRELTEHGHEVTMTIVGTSMEPFLLHARDRVCFRKPDTTLKKGDIVFYQRRSGEFVMHRIHKKSNNQYFLAGDHQTNLEGPITRDQIFAIVTEVQRNNVWINQKHIIWKFYAHCWRNLYWGRKIINKLRRIIKR